MWPSRPFRLAKLLGALVSVAFYAFLAVAVILLLAVPLIRAWAADSPNWVWGLKVPASAAGGESVITTEWGPARLEVQRVRAVLEIPIGALPWWLFALLWVHAAILFGLILGFLQQLRTILRRVADGVPFDAVNALRMRRLGWILLAGSLFNAVADFVASRLLSGELALVGMRALAGPDFNFGMLFTALVLVALAEVFRRGAELEHEHSLVI